MKRYLIETVRYDNDEDLENKLNGMTKRYRVKSILSDESIRNDLGSKIRILLELRKSK